MSALITGIRTRGRSSRLKQRWLVLTLALVLPACAGQRTFREAEDLLAHNQTEAGIAKLSQAMSQDPANNEYRRRYFTEREAAVNAAVREAERAKELGAFQAARDAYGKVQRLDPQNPKAINGLALADAAERHWKMLDSAMMAAKDGGHEVAIAKVQQVLSESPTNRRAVLLLRQLQRQQADASAKELGLYPKLRASYRVPVTLSFTNATLLQVFEALKQASGLNFMLERDVRPDLRVTLSVTKKPVEDIVRLLLATNQLERRVLDEDTLLIYPNTPAKGSEYREMVVRSFYLSYADATKVANTLRSIGKVKDVVVDEKLNQVIIRDSVEGVRLAEKLIASQDLAEAEVMLELEVLEVSVNRLLELGIHWPDSVSATVLGLDGVAGQLRLSELRNTTAQMVQIKTNDPLLSAQLRSTKGDANLLANPRVRIRNKQSAKVLIGERVPVITTIATANVGTSESVSYLDVGLKLDIEPTISLDDEVSMKVALEVSNILETITRASGTQAYRLGTRNTSTTLRLHDGETNILAGLIQRDERRSNTGVPGLNEIPIASKLFGRSQDSDTRTEIVLLITPRIIRNLDTPGVGLQEFLSGTESSVGAGPIQLGVSTPNTPASGGQQLPIVRPTVPPALPALPPNLPTPAAPSQAVPPPLTPPPVVPAGPTP